MAPGIRLRSVFLLGFLEPDTPYGLPRADLKRSIGLFFSIIGFIVNILVLPVMVYVIIRAIS